MAGVRVNAKLIPAEGGNHNIQVDLCPEGASMAVAWVVDPKSARNVAALLQLIADKAEQVIVMPAFDSVPPSKA